ncbi:carbohydrate-binding module family 50 protein [Sporormia fimetaria CBS 119925]|uniref:Carbohydrate-binding module family 50 protein n=1 Tax=Sporormia fimetaria CBS 119925 TaxID=1340428 RepID=A0A6A6V225_9PLEO|nr:carbohydrate-binding module family 50 protein [Sporormia fimetaria CBS 119925]
MKFLLNYLICLSAAFTIYSADELDVTLGDVCIKALSGDINCISYVQTFMMPKYHGSLEDVQTTDSVCTTDCSASLSSWFKSVSTSCAGKTLGGAVPMKFGGYMWAGFNETCVKDPKTKQYCNDIIANFTLVDTIQEMPKEELCHTCHVRRLAIMQASQYSVYDSFYKEQLEYVNAQCNLKNPTDIPPPLDPPAPTPTPYCLTNKRYTTKQGDTCEAIANASSVSAAALYMGNQALIPDCHDIDAGVNLCLPLTCQTYHIQPTDTCTSIERALGIPYGKVRAYNSWLRLDCSNLHQSTDFYGKVICASPQGGTFTGTFPAPRPTSNPGEITDGNTRTPVAPPNGATVADGTTLNCGKWHVVETGDTCSAICIQEGITANLFWMVNPSLVEGEGCTGSLGMGKALCVGPTYAWNTTVLPTQTVIEGGSMETGVNSKVGV